MSKLNSTPKVTNTINLHLQDNVMIESNGLPFWSNLSQPINNSAVFILSDEDYSPPNTKYMMRTSLWTICFVGIALNLIVFRKYQTAKKLHHSSIRNSIQLLCCMATADTLSLLALMLALSTRHLGIHHGHKTALALMCKMDLFVIHSASAFSIWCWLILSAIRYLAVFRPYEHLRLNREPLLIVLFTAFVCCLLESWIWFDVTYIEEAGICGPTLPEHVSKFLQVVEILWTYFLPLTLITVLDIKVLFCHSTWSKDPYWKETRLSPRVSKETRLSAIRSPTIESNISQLQRQSSGESRNGGILNGNGVGELLVTTSTVPLCFLVNQEAPLVDAKRNSKNLEKRTSRINSQNNMKWTHDCWKDMRMSNTLKNRRRAQQMRILKRCLCISIMDLGMNLPNYLIRLYITLIPDESLENMFFWVQDLSQLLYFAQFSLNALYLVGIIYVLPRNSSTKTTKSHHQPNKENKNCLQY